MPVTYMQLIADMLLTANVYQEAPHTCTILAVSLPVAKCAQPDMDADMAGRQSDETLCTPLCNQVGLEKEMQAT